jgi:cystathionine gamma-synthase
MTSPYTIAVSSGRPKPSNDGPINTPVSLNSTFHAGGDIGYSRYGNDTAASLEEVIGKLEGGKTLVFNSGMSAIKAVFDNIPMGSIIIASNQGYAGVNATLKQMQDQGKLIAKFVDISNTAEVLSELDGAYMLWLETPTNPRLDVADIDALVRACKAQGTFVGVDNTFATPLFQQPLKMGADISMNSVTKYMAGHSDVLCGSISSNNGELFNQIEFSRKISGTILQAFDAYLALRGIRTFPIRFEKAQANAKVLLKKISDHPMVSKVYYPGFGAMISFEVNTDAAGAENICSSSRLIANATSLGGVESLWERRRRWALESPLVPENLIRFSVGCEDPEDLWNDIKYALES